MYNKVINNIQNGCNISEKEAKKILRKFDVFGLFIALPINWIIYNTTHKGYFIIIAIITTIISIISANKMSNNKSLIEKVSKIMNIISIIIVTIWILGIFTMIIINN